MSKKTPNFEKALSELETLVDDMEQGNLSLEESLKRFEKGIALSTECQQALQNAELKIKELVEKNGKLLEQDIELEDWQPCRMLFNLVWKISRNASIPP